MNVTDRTPIQVVAIVPLSLEAGGDELLVFQREDLLVLPHGTARHRERLLDAAVRVVSEQAGFSPVPARIVYLLESNDGSVAIGAVCTLPSNLNDETDLHGEFVSLTQSDLPLVPMALREVLVEDLRSGFVRPVAHLVEGDSPDGLAVTVTW